MSEGNATPHERAPDLSEQHKLAFEAARDSTKQFLTLATGAIALTITFSKDFLGQGAPSDRPWALFAWAFFLGSVIFGLWTLLALTGTLEPGGNLGTFSIRGRNVTIPATLQIAFFAVGLVLTVGFGIRASTGAGTPPRSSQISSGDAYHAAIAGRLMDVADSVARISRATYAPDARALLQRLAADGAARVTPSQKQVRRAENVVAQLTNEAFQRSLLPTDAGTSQQRVITISGLQTAITRRCPDWPIC